MTEATSHPIIDAHVHIITPWRLGGLMRWVKRAFPEHPVPEDIDRNGILADLEAHGTRYFFNLVYPLRKRETEPLNDFNRNLCNMLPNAAGWGSLHPETPDKSDVTRRCIRDLGFIGMKFHPFVQAFDITDPDMTPVYETLNELRRPLFIHTGFDEFYGMNLPPENVDTLARAWPHMPLIMSHMLFPRLDEAMDLMAAHPQLWADLTNVPGAIRFMSGGAPLHETPPAQLLQRRLPDFNDRVIFGTDHPAGMGGYEQIYNDLHSLGIASETLRNATWDNPMKLVREYLPGKWDQDVDQG